MHFTKLFNSILDSTIWQESKDTKLVWITMLAMCDKNGEIHASIPGLAVRSGVSISECEDALTCLLSPDKYSRTKDEEGRRIVDIDGGWRLINHPKYRALLSTEERREYMAQKQREHRAKAASTNVKKCGDKSTKSTHTEAEAEADTNREREREAKPISEKLNPFDIPFLNTRSLPFLEQWLLWRIHSMDKGKTLHGISEQGQLMQLFDTYPDEAEAIAAIKHAIVKNWSNINLTGDHRPKISPPSNGRPKPQTNQEKLRAILKEQLGT